jgi:hypothetical protein
MALDAPVTPAMETGISDHVWSIEEIVGCSDEGGTHMRTMSALGWILTGAIVGGVVASSSRVQAQRDPKPSSPGQRLDFIAAGSREATRMYFVRDSKSGGCWLGQVENLPGDYHFSVLSPAPVSACDWPIWNDPLSSAPRRANSGTEATSRSNSAFPFGVDSAT